MGDRDRDRDRWVLPSSRARWKNGSCDTADAHGPVCARPAVVLLIAAGDAGTGTCAAAPRACQRVRGTRVRQHLAGAGRRLGAHGETVVRSDTVHANGLARVRHWWEEERRAVSRTPTTLMRAADGVGGAGECLAGTGIVTATETETATGTGGKVAAGKGTGAAAAAGTGSAAARAPRHGRGRR